MTATTWTSQVYARVCVVCVHSLHSRLEQLVQEYRKLYARKDEHGVTDKDTKSMHRSMKRKRSTMSNILQQLEAWASYTGTKEGLISESSLSSWLETGEPPEFVSNDVQLGKRLYMAEQDVKRCDEERCVLKVEIDRLCAWLTRKLKLAESMHSLLQKAVHDQAHCMCMRTAIIHDSMDTAVQKFSASSEKVGHQMFLAKHIVSLREHIATARKAQSEITQRFLAVQQARSLETSMVIET